jgi:short-subunit dehydrogenase
VTATGRVVVVTGASSGIGRATAIQLSRSGNVVVMASRSETALLAAQRDCVPGTTTVVPTDVSRRHEVDALMDEAIRVHGRVDAVVHAAAVLAYGRFEDVPAEVFDGALQTTLVGTANVARSALRVFATQGGGSLVVVGSLLGKIATPYMSSYLTAKWAVHGLVRCLQIEARTTPGVDISLVTPGGVNTPVYLQAGTYVRRHGRPPPPVVSPERVAGAIIRRLDRPARETNVGPANSLTVLGFRLFPGVFDRIVSPLMRAGGLSPQDVPHTAGNVLQPQPSGEAVRGPWDNVLGIVGQAGSPAKGGDHDSRPAPAPEALDGHGRTRVCRHVAAPPPAVWAVLSDGWLYANWVVGASRVRAVVAAGPAPGSRGHHSIGVWPAVVSDVSRCLEAEPGRRMVVHAEGWPLGEARVELSIVARNDGCEVTMVEDATAGPGMAIPRPARQQVIAARNREALRRLALIAEGRHREWTRPEPVSVALEAP